MSKSLERRRMLTILNGMDLKEYHEKSYFIMEKLIASEEFRHANTIGITLSRFPEVDTKPIIEAAWRAGKGVVIPRCLPSTREMDFRSISSFDCLETVYMDLVEPIVERTEPVEKHLIDLQLVPGVVFSNEGYRIGFGGGYYDRYLTDFTGNRVSLAFASQTGHDVPIESHDIPVEMIVTDQKIIHCARS